jgi:hypothetical protein
LPRQEKLISKWEQSCIIDALREGKNVVVDATNFNPGYMGNLKEIIKTECGDIKFEIKFFDVPVDECIKRDLKRPNSVGREVIMKFYDKYLKPEQIMMGQDDTLPHVIICDLDGNLALHVARSPYEFMKCHTDALNVPVAKVVHQFLHKGACDKIVYMSGREDEAFDLTVGWLVKHDLWHSDKCELHMRKTGDNRKDRIIKTELFDAYVRGKYYVDFVLDDRRQVVTMWREIGLSCFQVAPGDF